MNDWHIDIREAGPGLLRVSESDADGRRSHVIRDPAATDDEWEQGASFTIWEMNHVADK